MFLTIKEENKKIADERKQIMNHYGLNSQLFKMIEELNEAQAEVVKVLAGKKDADIAHLVEELADVALMTDQILDFYERREDFDIFYQYKLHRTLNRIEAAKRNKPEEKKYEL